MIKGQVYDHPPLYLGSLRPLKPRHPQPASPPERQLQRHLPWFRRLRHLFVIKGQVSNHLRDRSRDGHLLPNRPFAKNGEMNDSLQILLALAEGRHPLTGEALPEESCYQSAKVLRALLAGIEALEKTAGKKDRVLPGAAGNPWDAEEDAILVADFESGTAIKELAQTHRRTEGAIRSRLMKLGKLVP